MVEPLRRGDLPPTIHPGVGCSFNIGFPFLIRPARTYTLYVRVESHAILEYPEGFPEFVENMARNRRYPKGIHKLEAVDERSIVQVLFSPHQIPEEQVIKWLERLFP